MQHGGILLIFAAAICAFPVIVVFLIAPGGLLIRFAGSLAALVSFMVAGLVVWQYDLPPSEPVAAIMALASLLIGWRFAKFLHTKLLLPVDPRKRE